MAVAKGGRRWALTLAGLVLCVMIPVVAFSSPSVTGEQGTVDCGPTISAVFLIFPSDPAPGEAWAIEPRNAAFATRWLLMVVLAGVGAALLCSDVRSQHGTWCCLPSAADPVRGESTAARR